MTTSGIHSIEENSKEKKSIEEDNKKNKKETEFDVLINNNFDNEELKQTIYEFIKMRKTIKKPLTTKGLELMIKKLYKLSNNINEQIEILNNSIMNNWQSIYGLDNKKTEIKTKTYNNYEQREYNNLDFVYANKEE